MKFLEGFEKTAATFNAFTRGLVTAKKTLTPAMNWVKSNPLKSTAIAGGAGGALGLAAGKKSDT